MGFITVLQTIIQSTIDQFTSVSSTTIHFTNNFQQQAHDKGLTEKDAIDVYYHGQEVKPNMLIQKYNGYEIGIYYFKNKRTKRQLSPRFGSGIGADYSPSRLTGLPLFLPEIAFLALVVLAKTSGWCRGV